MKRAVFLDRDGVINEMYYNEEHGFADSPANPQQFKLKKGIAEFIKKIQAKGFLVIVVSNQPGIAKRKFSETLFKKICQKMKSQLKRQGAKLDGEYYCLHHPQAINLRYKKNCSCRKPKSGLILKAISDYNIDIKNSWLIGDGVNDILTGKLVGCKTVLLAEIKEVGYLKIIEEKLRSMTPDFYASNFNEIFKIIKNYPA